MIKVICQLMYGNYDNSCKDGEVLEYGSLEDWKKEIMKFYPSIHVCSNEQDNKTNDYWFGLQYDYERKGNYWFRWLNMVIDTEKGCLYSNGDFNLKYGLPDRKSVV